MNARKQKIQKKCQCLAGHIAYCEGNYRKQSFNHMCFFDPTAVVVMKTPAQNSAIIYENLLKPLPKNSVISIDIEFYAGYVMEGGKGRSELYGPYSSYE